MKTFSYPAGTVSQGTMRSEDLIGPFSKVLQEIVDNTEWEEASQRRRILVSLLEECRKTGKDGPWQDVDWCVEQLFEVLDDLAPEGYYFGAHSFGHAGGDGSDYGFWPFHDRY